MNKNGLRQSENLDSTIDSTYLQLGKNKLNICIIGIIGNRK